MNFSPDARPRLRAKAQLRFDRFSGRYLLLYPERGLRLSHVATEVVRCCDGEHSVSAIIDRLAMNDRAPAREVVASCVQSLLRALANRGLVGE